MNLVQTGKLDRSKIKEVVEKTNRLSLLEAYGLIVMGVKSNINSFTAATDFLKELFKTEEADFSLNSKSGEAEIIREAIYLWLNLQEVKL